ncbi:MAG: hypothetical protein ACMUIL_03300 [bacterium]
MNRIFFKSILIILTLIIAIGVISSIVYSQEIHNLYKSVRPQIIIDNFISAERTEVVNSAGLFFSIQNNAIDKDYVSKRPERFNAPPKKDKSKGLGLLIIGIVFIVATIIMLVEYIVMKRNNVGYLVGIIFFMVGGVALGIVGIVFLV